MTLKNIIYSIFLIFFVSTLWAQNASQKLYDPNANAEKQLQEAIQQAKKENKHVLLKIGGNWCSWCIKFHQFVENDDSLKQLINANYVMLNINYSKENKNLPTLKQLAYPQRFGFPVFVILDENGKRLHTQDSGYLESGKSYDKDKVERFFQKWTKLSLDPQTYKDQ